MGERRYSVELLADGRSMGSIGVYRTKFIAHLVARREHRGDLRLRQSEIGRWVVVDRSEQASMDDARPEHSPAEASGADNQHDPEPS